MSMFCVTSIHLENNKDIQRPTSPFAVKLDKLQLNNNYRSLILTLIYICVSANIMNILIHLLSNTKK